MSPIPGTRTTTTTTTEGNVVTVVTTVVTPGQPTRITTTTKTTKSPSGQPADGQRIPAQLGQPQPQGRPQPVYQQQPSQPQPQLEAKPDSDAKRKNGLFSTLKKHVLRSEILPKKSLTFLQRSPTLPPAPAPQQQQQRPRVPSPVPQQQKEQNSIPPPAPTPVVRVETEDPVGSLEEKMRLAALNRPTVVEHRPTVVEHRPTVVEHRPTVVEHRPTVVEHRPTVVEHHSSSTTTQNGAVVQQSNTSYSGEVPEDAIALLKKSQPLLAPDFGGQRLDVNSIDFSREDAHACACPNSETATIARLSHYLTSPCSGDKVSQLRTIYTWIANNIAYDVPGFMAGKYGDQTPEGVLRNRQAVCEGYSNLFIALAEPAGLEVQKVIGLARGVDIQVGDERMGSPHAWNAVTVDGEYLLIDSTWGAGVCDLSTRSFRKLFRSFFFLLRPNRLIYTHWPENPKQQFMDPPISESVFRGLPAIKPESWTLGIKLSGKHRGQVIRTNDDSILVEVKLKKRPSDGATGKIVARLNWKGQAVPTSVQWLREDPMYVYMTIKCSCPTSGQGELSVFGWPPGGDQTKSGPQCLSFKVINEGSGQTAKPMLKQYVVKGFSFSVLEPMSAQVQKGVPQAIRIRVFDVEKGIQPALAVQGPEGGMPERLAQIEPGLFEIKKVLTGGSWKIVHMTSEYAFSFAAVFDAV